MRLTDYRSTVSTGKVVKGLVLSNLNNSILFQTASWMTVIAMPPIGSSALSARNQTRKDFSAPRTHGEQIKVQVIKHLQTI